ncbi:hypothetical protein KBD34_00820 [Patescibacteria group bacterium]|nr:hypothetical protein [Patescibacteria group bacterium]
MNTLISISDLITESWNFFSKDWKTIVKRNAWLVPVMVVYFALYFGGVAMKIEWLTLLGLAVLLIGSILVTVHAMRYVLHADGNVTQATAEKSISQLFLPVCIVGIIVALGSLGGFILLILPGIWFRVASAFSFAAYLEEGQGGTNAVGRSLELVKGRWWKTLWRLLLPSIVFQAIIGLISFATFIIPIILLAVGGAGAMMRFSEGGSPALSGGSLPILIAAGILFIAALIVNLGLSLVATGLAQVVQAKLFHSLKASR